MSLHVWRKMLVSEVTGVPAEQLDHWLSELTTKHGQTVEEVKLRDDGTYYICGFKLLAPEEQTMVPDDVVDGITYPTPDFAATGEGIDDSVVYPEKCVCGASCWTIEGEIATCVRCGYSEVMDVDENPNAAEK